MKYLSENTKVFVEKATVEDRIEATRKFKWIGYTMATKILSSMQTCLVYPKTSRMPNLLIVGDSNNGKTEILSKFDKSNPAYIEEETDRLVNPVLLIQAPPEPDEKRFYNAILDKLFAPTKTSEKIDSRYSRVKRLLTELDTRVLMIDEIHHVLTGSPAKQRLFLNVLKHLANELRIPLVCAGTKLAFNAIQTDSQLANRFEPKVIPRWSNNSEYKRLLMSYSKILPLKKESFLVENSISNNILVKSEGLIGEISKILELSTILAIESGTESITNTILDSIDYIQPSKRKMTYSV